MADVPNTDVPIVMEIWAALEITRITTPITKGEQGLDQLVNAYTKALKAMVKVRLEATKEP